MTTHPASLTFPLALQAISCAIILAGLFASASAAGAPAGQLPVPERGFISSQPAETWEQGLISGNGTIGANVFGRPLDEVIVFTHERLFVPIGKPVVPPDTASRLADIRKLIDQGMYKEATQLAFDLSGQESFMYGDPFVPAFDLNVKMQPEGKVSDYMRSVDFRTGESAVHWADSRGAFERRLFVSRADKVAVLLIRGPKPGTVNCRLELTPRRPSDKLEKKQVEHSNERFGSLITDVKTTAQASRLTFSNGFAKAYPGSIQALEGVARVAATGGKASAEGAALVITGADEVLVLVDIKLLHDPRRSVLTEMTESLGKVPADYQGLLTRHRRIHGQMFDRMRLDVGGGADHQLTTEQLLAKSTDEDLCKALIEKEFDAGRYNIISSTGELPPTLQGVWAGTYVPSWASDFTHNGNVPSAIASMLMGNTPELMLAYTSYIESLVPDLQVNARHMFGARGVVLPSRSTTHGYNNALAPNFAGGFWVAGAPWAAHFFYDYYLYTGDRKFLAEHALPFMEQAAMFFEDYLYEGPDGKYVFSPTTSPENSPSNTRSQGTFNATMDVAAAKELLNNLIAASGELGVNKDKVPVWQKMLTRMPDYMISDQGVVKEWLTDKLTDNLDHRHSSQLYALYDGMPDEIARDPKLRAAFRRIIEIKLDQHWKTSKSGFMSFGVVQLGQAATSLGEGELAWRCLTNLVNRYWLSNLASMHNTRSLFNMDTSGGMPAVIIKMLVESAPGRIQLLPALPAAWPAGTIEGVLCRGQIEVKSLKWTPGNIKVALVSGKKQTIVLEAPRSIAKISVAEPDASIENASRDSARKVSLPAGKVITLDIVLK
jgi:hypothetical protein